LTITDKKGKTKTILTVAGYLTPNASAYDPTGAAKRLSSIASQENQTIELLKNYYNPLNTSKITIDPQSPASTPEDAPDRTQGVCTTSSNITPFKLTPSNISSSRAEMTEAASSPSTFTVGGRIVGFGQNTTQFISVAHPTVPNRTTLGALSSLAPTCRCTWSLTRISAINPSAEGAEIPRCSSPFCKSAVCVLSLPGSYHNTAQEPP
jgi:hypothetical protein